METQCYVVLEIIENELRGEGGEIAGFVGIQVFDGEKWWSTPATRAIYASESVTHTASEDIIRQISRVLGDNEPIFVSYSPQLTVLKAVRIGFNIGPHSWIDLTSFVFALGGSGLEKTHDRLERQTDISKMVQAVAELFSTALRLRANQQAVLAAARRLTEEAESLEQS